MNEEQEEQKQTEENFFYNIQFPSNKVHCDFCDKEITRQAKIYCADCKIDICLNCFGDCVENETHQANHAYYIINKLNFPVYTVDWSLEEELLLLESLEKFGFGNWNAAADHISTDKTPEECEKHYEDIYISQQNFIPKQQILTKRNSNLELKYPKMEKKNIEDNLKTRKKNQKEKEKKEQFSGGGNRTSLTTANQTNSGNNASDIIGYMPLRGDFDVEYDNDAELLLAEMEFADDDTEHEIKLKQQILEIYNARLDERIKRKQFVIERRLLDFNYQSELDKTRTKQEKEIYNLMRVFARFNTPDAHEELCQGICKAKKLQQRIEELSHYKKLGLKTLADVEHYLAEKRAKDEDYNKRQKNIDNTLFEEPNKTSMQRKTRDKRDIMEGKGKEEKKIGLSPFFNLLEREFCEKNDLSQKEYLYMKDMLIRESVKEGFIKRDFAENSLKIDKERINAVFDFLLKQHQILEKV